MKKSHFRMKIRSNLSLTCALEADLLQNTNGNDEVIIIVEIRRIRKNVCTGCAPSYGRLGSYVT